MEPNKIYRKQLKKKIGLSKKLLYNYYLFFVKKLRGDVKVIIFKRKQNKKRKVTGRCFNLN